MQGSQAAATLPVSVFCELRFYSLLSITPTVMGSDHTEIITESHVTIS